MRVMPKGYLRSETSVHYMNYHFVWCPKYRRKVLVDKVALRLQDLLKAKVSEMGCKTIALEIMPDHVHIFIQANPLLAPNTIVGMLKGYSSKVLRQEFLNCETGCPPSGAEATSSLHT